MTFLGAGPPGQYATALAGADVMTARNAPSHSPRETHRSWLRAVIAPSRGLARPVQFASDLVGASGSAFATTLVVHTFVFASAVVAFRLWRATVEPFLSERPGARLLGVPEVWRAWHAEGNFGPAERTFLLVTLLVILVAAFVSWLLFPYAHVGRSLWATYRRTFRAVISCAGVVIFVTAAHGGLFACATHVFSVARRVDGKEENTLPIAIIVAAVPVSLCLLTWWTSRVVRLTRPPVPATESSARCEGCGYDLTHRPDSGLCSECGYSLADSLTVGRKRSGCSWERRPGVGSWCRNTLDVLLHTGRFYGALPVRGPDDDAVAFARWHYFLIGCVAGCCFFVAAFTNPHTNWDAVLAMASVGLFVWPLLAWLALRINTTLVVFWWVARGSTLRLGLTRKIPSYESAYVSLISIAAAFLFGSFIRFGGWLSDILGRDFFARTFGTNAEIAVVIVSIAVVCGLWHWRITLGIRAVRWSNF